MIDVYKFTSIIGSGGQFWLIVRPSFIYMCVYRLHLSSSEHQSKLHHRTVFKPLVVSKIKQMQKVELGVITLYDCSLEEQFLWHKVTFKTYYSLSEKIYFSLKFFL